MELSKTMLSLVVPVYNEEDVLPLSFERMNEVMKGIGCRYEIIYVDDGSRDGTWPALANICRKEPRVKALRFARNFGHQLAVTAGIDEARGDAVIIIDADLQDPPEIIPQMVQKWQEGFEVVYGKRLKREGETLFKKFTAFAYYRMLKFFSAYPIPLDTGDFRLIDAKVADVLRGMREHNRFLRGMSAWAGFSQCPVEYVRHERAAGKTKYTLKKMVKLAMDGILGSSGKPVTLSFGIGAGICALSGIAELALLIWQIVIGWNMAGWSLLIPLFTLLNGVMLMMMGVQGAYISRIYDEVQNRPLYLIGEKRGEGRPRSKQYPAGQSRSDGQSRPVERSRLERDIGAKQAEAAKSKSQGGQTGQPPMPKPGEGQSKSSRRRRNKGRRPGLEDKPQNLLEPEAAASPSRERIERLRPASEKKAMEAGGTESNLQRAQDIERLRPRAEVPEHSAAPAQEAAAGAYTPIPMDKLEFVGVEYKGELTEKWLADRAARRNNPRGQ